MGVNVVTNQGAHSTIVVIALSLCERVEFLNERSEFRNSGEGATHVAMLPTKVRFLLTLRSAMGGGKYIPSPLGEGTSVILRAKPEESLTLRYFASLSMTFHLHPILTLHHYAALRETENHAYAIF